MPPPTGLKALTPPPPSSPSSYSPRSPRHVPLLSLAPCALPSLEDTSPEEDLTIKDIWNVISRAADVVKDGERLENLAWRHWGQPQSRRRTSNSSCDTASSASLSTPTLEHPPTLSRSRSFEKRSFGGMLKLLVEEDSFKDWVEDAKRHMPSATLLAPTISVPHTPMPSVEIRLVEPTPAPSRVGSLGGSSIGAAGHLFKPVAQPLVKEEIKEESEASTDAVADLSRRHANRFFIHSSPGKASVLGTSESPHSSPIPQAIQPDGDSTVGSHRRSSGDSSSAIVIKGKKDRRHVSMANMRGRFAGEKARAAEAISARKQNKVDESDDWEDEDEDEDEEDWEDDEEQGNRQKQQVVPDLTRQVSGGAPPRSPTLPTPPPPTPPPPKSKKQKAAEKAKALAEKDAQRKREMFAKKQIFGSQPTSEGLLSNIFRTGKSMVDLTQAGKEQLRDEHLDTIRRAPTHAQLTSLAQSPAPTLLRSKSAIAMPELTGVSVTARSHHSRGSEEKRKPSGLVMETSDEESDDDDYLASSQVRRKIEELAAKRDMRGAKESPQNASTSVAQAIPSPQPPVDTALDENGVVRPLSPTTRRRTIIMREMSASLRKNLIIEREKSSGRTNSFGHARPPPSINTSRLPTSSSAVNLSQYGAPLQRYRSNPDSTDGRSNLERHNSQPDLLLQSQARSQPTNPVETPQSPVPQVTDNIRRRPPPNVLGGFLRPLTRVGVENTAIGRTQSSAQLNTPSQRKEASPPSPVIAKFKAPPMIRSSTEGDSTDLERARKRELAKRSETMDTSYRLHGW